MWSLLKGTIFIRQLEPLWPHWWNTPNSNIIRTCVNRQKDSKRQHNPHSSSIRSYGQTERISVKPNESDVVVLWVKLLMSSHSSHESWPKSDQSQHQLAKTAKILLVCFVCVYRTLSRKRTASNFVTLTSCRRKKIFFVLASFDGVIAMLRVALNVGEFATYFRKTPGALYSTNCAAQYGAIDTAAIVELGSLGHVQSEQRTAQQPSTRVHKSVSFSQNIRIFSKFWKGPA